MTHAERLQRSIAQQYAINALVKAAGEKERLKPGFVPPSKIPARHRVMMVVRYGVYEFADLAPTAEATESLLINGRWWQYAGCLDGVAVYNNPSGADA
jgi:hypothetical protein